MFTGKEKKRLKCVKSDRKKLWMGRVAIWSRFYHAAYRKRKIKKDHGVGRKREKKRKRKKRKRKKEEKKKKKKERKKRRKQ